jgi:hypothetical protein
VLDSAIEAQGIEDDGALAACILGKARGAVLKGHFFHKRYQGLWPGFGGRSAFFLKPQTSQSFIQAKSNGLRNLSRQFPEYYKEISDVFDKYNEHWFTSNFSIV